MVGFPLLLIPLAVYNIIVFLMPGVSFADPLIKLTLMSGAEWQVTLSDILLAVGVVLLLLEVIKGARPGAKYLTDHLLSLIVFGGSAAEFVMLPKFGTSTFFLLSLMAMVDFFGGIALRARRGTATVARTVPAKAETAKVEPPVEGAHETPAPAGAGHPAASAASVAESVLLDHPKPDPAKPDPAKPDHPKLDQSRPAAAQTTGEASPDVPSPELQPGPDSTPDGPHR